MERKEPNIAGTPQKFRIFLLLFGLGLQIMSAKSQEMDTTARVPEVTIDAYLSKQNPERITGSIGVVDSSVFAHHRTATLLSSINSLPGVNMEERSPGSYRLSVRGSVLRSPFGVRNVKIYLDEIPLTDATGNTYLNAVSLAGMKSVTVLKGPDGSLYGANSGGVVLIKPPGFGAQGSEANVSLRGASYGSFTQQAKLNAHPSDKYRMAFSQSYEKSNGFREQSALKRVFLQTTQRWFYNAKSELRFTGFASNLDYETPGGLTAEQYNLKPRQARPATEFSPGATEQDARITNKMLWGGLIHEFTPVKNLRNVTTIFGSLSDFTNPFITNYENRDETNWGFRSWFEHKLETKNWEISTHVGTEFQRARHGIFNYENLSGHRGNPQSADIIFSTQHSYFARMAADWRDRLLLEISASLNRYNYKYREAFPNEIPGYTIIPFDLEWMPRFAISYVITNDLTARTSFSKGYSTPTIAEVRASNQIINTNLRPEGGWNQEAGIRWTGERFHIDLAAFNFRMHNAIIREVNSSDEEFFQNTGRIIQRGIEGSATVVLFENANNWINELQLKSGIALNDFKFLDYKSGGENWSGNKVTGVPALTYNNLLSGSFRNRININLWHFFKSRTPLNDGNTVFSAPYHLIQANASWSFLNLQRLTGAVWFEVDNLLDEHYSLGNDINAYGGRYFNPAPARNFALGVRMTLR